jgi:hypothetical protein
MLSGVNVMFNCNEWIYIQIYFAKNIT